MKLGIYYTLGDGGLAQSEAIFRGAILGGATLLEVGLPFSDPLLDGPVVQASHTRATKNEIPWSDLCASLERIKSMAGNVQISLMASAQLFYDLERCKKLPAVDGILLTDIKYDKPSPVVLPSPRVWFLSQQAALSKNFAAPAEAFSMVYLTRLQGITGENQNAATTTGQAIARIKSVTKTPVWLGFGISSKKDLADCAAIGADGGIIGSAFVKAVSEKIETTGAQVKSADLETFARNWVEQLLLS